jgi:hypothetical protein
VENLNITEHNDVKYATFNMTLTLRVQTPSGQWVNKQVVVPFYAEGRKAELIEEHVPEGREVYIQSYYDTWETGGQMAHSHKVISISFGYMPRQNPQTT